MTEEYRWTDEADRRARALIERMAVSTDGHRDYIDARDILDKIKVNPVEAKLDQIIPEWWRGEPVGVRGFGRDCILAGIELGKKDAAVCWSCNGTGDSDPPNTHVPCPHCGKKDQPQ